MRSSEQHGFTLIELMVAVANRQQIQLSHRHGNPHGALLEAQRHQCMGSSCISGSSRPGHEDGFTLIELMVVVAIAAILAGLAAPSFREMMASNRLKSHSTSLRASLLLARSEAIKRNTRVVLCKSANGTACTTAGGWQQGWIIFADANNNAALDAGEAVIRQIQTLSGDFVLKGNAHIANYVSYSSTGSTKLVSGAFQSGTFTLCQRAVSNGKSRDIIISATGRPRVVLTTEAVCSP